MYKYLSDKTFSIVDSTSFLIIAYVFLPHLT